MSKSKEKIPQGSHDKAEGTEEVYLISEVAAKLKMSERSAYNLCAETDAFIVKRCGPKLLRVNKASFDRWLDSK